MKRMKRKNIQYRLLTLTLLCALCTGLFGACTGQTQTPEDRQTATATATAEPSTVPTGETATLTPTADPATGEQTKAPDPTKTPENTETVEPTDVPTPTPPTTEPPTVTPTVPTDEPTPTPTEPMPTEPTPTEPTPTVPTDEPTPTPTIVDPPHDLSPGDIVNWCGHQNVVAAADQDATCTVDGFKDRLKCADCGAVLDGTGKIIPAYHHVYNNRRCVYCSKNQPSLVTGGQYEHSGVIWQLYDDGELAVSGKGEIPSFPEKENSYFFGYNKAIKSIVVYYGVTSIGDNAFRNLKEVLTVSISSSVRHIGDHAFDGWSLKTLNLSYGLTTVGSDNFTENRLFFLELPGSVTAIGAGSFNSSQLVTLRVPATVRRFDAHENQYSAVRNIAFMGDESAVTGLDIYRHLRLDGACANVSILFKFTAAANTLPYCTRRGSVSGDFTYSYFTDKTVVITAYRGKSSNVVIPETLSSYTVVGIEHECFKNNKTIKSVTLPATLKDICYKAFIDSSIEELTILGTNVRVGEAAFSGCSSLKTLHFEGVFLEVGGKAFANTKIEHIPLSPDMTYARISSFASSAVKNVDYTQFEVIGNSAFARTSASSVDLTGVREVGYGAFYSVGLKNLTLTGVEKIERAAFIGNSSLKAENIVGLSDVPLIEEGAFDFKV